MFVLPLCHKHHQEKDNQVPQRWVSRHGDGRAAFEAEYGDEADLLLACVELLFKRLHTLVAAKNLRAVLAEDWAV